MAKTIVMQPVTEVDWYQAKVVFSSGHIWTSETFRAHCFHEAIDRAVVMAADWEALNKDALRGAIILSFNIDAGGN